MLFEFRTKLLDPFKISDASQVLKNHQPVDLSEEKLIFCQHQFNTIQELR